MNVTATVAQHNVWLCNLARQGAYVPLIRFDTYNIVTVVVAGHGTYVWHLRDAQPDAD